MIKHTILSLVVTTIGAALVFGLFTGLYYLAVAIKRRSAARDVEAFLTTSLAGRASVSAGETQPT